MASAGRPLAIMIGCGALIVAIAMGARQSFGLLLQPMTADLGIGREAFGLAIAVQNLVFGLASPLAGYLADRFGAPRVVVGCALLYAAGLAGAAYATDETSLMLWFGVLVGLAQAGTTYVVVFGPLGRAVPAERRSSTLGLTSALGSFGMVLAIPLAQFVLVRTDWHTLLLVSAAMFVLPLIAALGLRERQSGSAAQIFSIGRAVSMARGHDGFWLLTAGFFVCGFQLAFIGTHLPAYLMDHGLSIELGGACLAVIGAANVVGTYVAGKVGDLYRKKWSLAAIYTMRSIAILAFIAVPPTPASALVFSAAMGLLWLSTVPLTSGLIGQIFGPAALSTLYGFVFLGHQVGSFFGAWLGGLAFDLTGSYTPVWLAAIVLGLVAALLHMPIRDAALVPDKVPA